MRSFHQPFLLMLLSVAANEACTGTKPFSDGLPAHGKRPAGVVALTFDDLPFVGGVGPDDSMDKAAGRIITALRSRRVPATGFVVCGRISPGAPILRRWLAAGLELGNHSSTHPHIDDLDLDGWTRDVRQCRDRLKSMRKGPVRYFRYPFLQTGRTLLLREAAKRRLREMGHLVAPVTVDTGEWVLVRPYIAALRSGRRRLAGEIGRAWLSHVMAAWRHYQRYSMTVVARPVKQVLLLHANVLAADHLASLISSLESEGVLFVTLEKAIRDPVYRLADRYVGSIGLSWLYRIVEGSDRAWRWDRAQETAMRRRFLQGDAIPELPGREER